MNSGGRGLYKADKYRLFKYRIWSFSIKMIDLMDDTVLFLGSFIMLVAIVGGSIVLSLYGIYCLYNYIIGV